MSKHFAKQKKTLQESILLFLCLYRLIRRRGIKYKILTSYQNKICAICLAKCSILSYHSRYLMSISLQALNSSSWVVFYSYSCEYMHKLLHTCKCPSGFSPENRTFTISFLYSGQTKITYIRIGNEINISPKSTKINTSQSNFNFSSKAHPPFRVYLRNYIKSLILK